MASESNEEKSGEDAKEEAVSSDGAQQDLSTKEQEFSTNTFSNDEADGKGAAADIKMSETVADISGDTITSSNINSSNQQTDVSSTDTNKIVPTESNEGSKATEKSEEEATAIVQPTSTLKSQDVKSNQLSQSMVASSSEEKLEASLSDTQSSNEEVIPSDLTQTTEINHAQPSTVDSPPSQEEPSKVDIPTEEAKPKVIKSDTESEQPSVDDQVHVNDGTTTMVMGGTTTILPPEDEMESSILQPSVKEEKSVLPPSETASTTTTASLSQKTETEQAANSPSTNIEIASQTLPNNLSSIADGKVLETIDEKLKEEPKTENATEILKAENPEVTNKSEESVTNAVNQPELQSETLPTVVEPETLESNGKANVQQNVNESEKKNEDQIGSPDIVGSTEKPDDTSSKSVQEVSSDKPKESDSETVTPTPSISEDKKVVKSNTLSAVDKSLMTVIEMVGYFFAVFINF